MERTRVKDVGREKRGGGLMIIKCGRDPYLLQTKIQIEFTF